MSELKLRPPKQHLRDDFQFLFELEARPGLKPGEERRNVSQRLKTLLP